MAMKRFETRATFLLTATERSMLQDLADREELSASDVVRRLIRTAHKEAFGEQVLAAPRSLKKAPKRK